MAPMQDLTITDVRRILEEQNASPSKRRSQNFLIDSAQIGLIAETVLAHSEQTIIEIGPGLGALTRRLLDADRTVYAIELDRAFCRYLSQTAHGKFHLLEGDALEYLASWRGASTFPLGEEPPFVCGNLPYSITTDLLRSTARIAWIPGGVFLTQLEFAARITASNSLSSLGIYLRNFGSWTKLRVVGKKSFYPSPTVDSALIEFARGELSCDPDMLERVLRSSFHSKRKKISNSWKFAAKLHGLSIEALHRAAEQCAVGTDMRPEEILDTKYYELTRLLGGLSH